MGFDVKAARQAGYSDSEIAAHLAEDQNFDLAGATQAGYTPEEIINELAPAVTLTLGQRVNRKLFGDDGATGNYATGILTSLKETVTGAGRPPSEIPWSEIPGQAFETVKRTLAKTVAGARLEAQETARRAWAQPGVMEAMPAQTRNVLQNPDFQDTIDREKDILRQMQADEQALAERNPSFAQETALGTAGSLAAAGPAVAVGVTTRNPKLVAATIFAGSQPLSYAESRMQGIEPTAAQRAANIKAAIEVGTEYLPAKALFKTGSPAFQRLQHFLAAEIPGESIATIGQTLTDYLSALPDDVTGQDIIDGLAQGVSQLPQTAATTVAAGGAQVGIVDVLNRAGAGIEARLRDRIARRQALRPPRVEVPPVEAPAPPDLPPQTPEAPPEAPPAPPGPPATPGPEIPPAPPAAPPVPPGPAAEPPTAPPAPPPEVPAGPPVAPPETSAPPPAQPPAPPPISQPAPTTQAPGPGWAQPPPPAPEPTYRVPNPDTGVEAQVRPNGQGGFAVVLQDTDSGETVPMARVFPDEAAARAYAHEIAGVPAPAAGPTEIRDEPAQRDYVRRLAGQAPLDPDERHAIETYATAATSTDESRAWSDPALADKLRSAARKILAPEDFVVYRGAAAGEVHQNRSAAGVMLPTSLSRRWAETMAEAKWANPAIQRIIVRKGTPLVPVAAGDGNEFEILLPDFVGLRRLSSETVTSDVGYRLDDGSVSPDDWEIVGLETLPGSPTGTPSAPPSEAGATAQAPEEDPFAPENIGQNKSATDEQVAARIATDEQLRADLADLVTRAGWSVKGGRMITRGDFETTIGGAPDVVGRTMWEPRELWWLERPPGVTEKSLAAAVKRALAGKPLGPNQKEAVRFLVLVADERAGRYDDITPEAGQITAEDLANTEHPLTAEISRLAQMASAFVDEATIDTILEAKSDADVIRQLEAILKEHGHGLGASVPGEVGPQGSEGSPRPTEGAGSVSAQKAGGDLFGGSDRTAINERNARVERKLGKDRGPVPADNAPPGDIFRDAADRAAAQVQGTQADIEDGDVQAARTPGVQKAAAGAAYVGMMNPPAAAAPSIPLGTQATGTARTVSQPKAPLRREHIMELFQRELGLKIYQGKPFKVRRALGYFRPSNFEIRNKNLNDLEVAAHEVFHWIDRTYPTIRRLYHRRRFHAELTSVSYDASKIDEGFAEFGRLFMTNETEAVARTPEFYRAFVAEAKAVGIFDKLSRVQEKMHLWYLQGAEARATSKIGEVPPPISAQLTKLLDNWGDKAIAWGLDQWQAAKVIERVTSGGIAADAVNSPYKGLRLLAGARSVANTWLNYGTLEIGPRGDFVLNGPGLRQIFEPVADVMDDALAYFVGRRAAELKRYGKENLFKTDEIEALLAKGTNSPKAQEIAAAFAAYQAYVDRLMDFAIQTGIVSQDTVDIWRQMYQNYVPFYRVAEGLGGGNVSGSDSAMGKAGALFKRLKGGTGNLRDTWENLTYNTAIVVHAGLKNLAKRQLFAQIQQSPLGQRYAVKIPTDTHAVPVAMQQVENVLRQMVNEAKTRAMDPNATVADRLHYAQVAQALDVLTGQTNAAGGAALDEIQQQATFFTQGHPPSIPDKDSILVGGKRVWYQIGDPMLWDMLVELNVYKPLSVAEQILGFAKRTLTRGVTMSPEFQIANILRDTFAAFTLSKAGQIPVVDAVRAMRDIWSESDAYVSFLANGGGFGNALSNETKGVRLRLQRLDRHHLIDLPSKMLDFWDKWGQSFELATRLAEYKRDVAAGYTAREAAYQGREVSSDFAMRGKSELVRLAITSLPFFGARVQGLYKLERELFEKRGRQSWTGERALIFATRALVGITLPSLLLYWINGDDEDYKSLPEETRNLFWAVKWWGSDALPATEYSGYAGPTYKTKDAVYILIPKPFEVGALFSTIPERIWQSLTEKHPKALIDAAMFTIVNTFQVDPVPQLVKPAVDVFYRNRYWTGAPIVPFSLQNVEPSEQYRPWTAPSMVAMGERFNVSPLKLEALVNGYLGTMGQYSIMAADALVSGEGATGDEPSKRLSQYPVFRRFLREQPYSRTAYETRFYELADEVTITVNTMAKMRREGRADKIENYLGQSEKLRLFALGKIAGKIGDQARDIDAAMRAVRNNPFLSGDQKRLQMDRMQQEQNELFRQAVQALDVPTLEKYRNALEGKP